MDAGARRDKRVREDTRVVQRRERRSCLCSAPTMTDDETSYPSTERQMMLRPFLRSLAVATAAALAITAPAPAHAAAGVTRLNVAYTSPAGVSAKYHYFPSGNTDAGLLVYLDGDGQWGFDHPTAGYALGGSAGIVAAAQARGLDVLAVRTPASDGTWWRQCARNADYLKSLMTQAGLAYDQNRVWLTGYSGGAQFITQCYLPRASSTIGGGGSVVFGGGGAPTVSVTPATASFKKAFTMHWITGTDDTAARSSEGYDALKYAKAGARYYARQGYTTRTTWPTGIDHDEITGQFGNYIGKALDASGAPTTGSTPIPTPSPTTSAWTTNVSVTSTYADVTVSVPATAAGKKVRVTAYGSDGSYWYDEASGAAGAMTFRLGDPGDWLSTQTTYTYTVTVAGTQVARGSFRTA